MKRGRWWGGTPAFVFCRIPLHLAPFWGFPPLWGRGYRRYGRGEMPRWKFSTLAMLHATCVDIYTVWSVRSSQPRVEAISHHRTPHSEQLRQVPPVSPPAARVVEIVSSETVSSLRGQPDSQQGATRGKSSQLRRYGLSVGGKFSQLFGCSFWFLMKSIRLIKSCQKEAPSIF